MTSSNDAPSIRIGSYQLTERVGEGGSARVYRATSADGQLVAVKLLAGRGEGGDDTAEARFVREIRSLSEVSHPNLVALLDSGVDPELGPYLVTPLIAGTTLRALLGGRPVCPEAALLLLAPLLDGVAALHAAGLVHRDLKPENVMATPAGSLVVVDLGLAYRQGQTRYTEEGAVVGSVPYMAPEQVEGRQVGPAADLWAIGVMAYEWLTGRRPFERERPAEEAAAILVGAHAPVSSVDRRVDAELAALVEGCLVADPARRPTAADALARVRAAIDWVDHGALSFELSSMVAAPAEYQQRVAPHRVGAIVAAARAAIAAGNPFGALDLVDRALAYAPDDPALAALAEEAEHAAATPGPAQIIAPSRRPAPATAPPGMAAGPLIDSGGAAAPAPRRRLGPYVAAALIIGGIAAVSIVASQVSDQPVSSPSPSGPASRTTVTTSGLDDEVAMQLIGGFVDVFEKGLAAEERRQAAERGLPPPAPRAGLRDLAGDRTELQVFGGMVDIFARGMALEERAESARAPVADLVPIPVDLLPARGADDARSLRIGPDEPLIRPDKLPDGDPAGTRRAVEAELSRTPDDPLLLGVLAAIDLAEGRRAEGLRALDELLARFPDQASLWTMKGYVEIRRGRPAEADRALTRALALDPADADAYRNRGILRTHMGRVRDGYADLTAALALAPGDLEAMRELVRIYESVGRGPAAEPLRRRLAASDPAADGDAPRR